MKIGSNKFSFIRISVAAILILSLLGCTAQTVSQPPIATQSRNSEPSQTTEEAAFSPIIVQKDGNIILLCAERSVTLCSAGELGSDNSGAMKLLGMVSGNLNYIYFLTGYDSKTGTGTLMGVSTDAKSPPILVSDGVYSARDSANGDVLFMKNFEDGVGDLYLYNKAGSPELKVQSIVDIYGFSPDGKSIYYVVKDGGYYILYTDIKGIVEKIFEAPAKDFRHYCIFLKDDGSILYGASYSAETLTLYIYSNDKNSEVITGAQPIFILDSLDFFFQIKTDEVYPGGSVPVYCKEIGKDAVCVSQDGCWLRFPDYINGIPFGKSVLLVEEDPDNPKPTVVTVELDDSDFSDFSNEPANIFEDTSSKNKVLLYEYMVGGDKTFISKADEFSQPPYFGPEINKQFTAVSYELDGVLYIALKRDGAWVSRQLTRDAIQYCFDGSGKNFYWVDKEYNLYKMNISDEKEETLKSGILSFTISGDEIYYADNINTFRMSDGAALCGNADFITATQGGVYIRKTNGDYLYFVEGSDKGILVIQGSEGILLSGYRINLSYLSSGDSEMLKNLAEDANYYLNKYGMRENENVISSPHGTLEEDAAFADSFLPGSIPSNYMTIAEYFSEGFKALEKWVGNQNDTDALSLAKSKLSLAASICENSNWIQ